MELGKKNLYPLFEKKKRKTILSAPGKKKEKEKTIPSVRERKKMKKKICIFCSSVDSGKVKKWLLCWCRFRDGIVVYVVLVVIVECCMYLI